MKNVQNRDADASAICVERQMRCYEYCNNIKFKAAARHKKRVTTHAFNTQEKRDAEKNNKMK